MLAVLHVSDFPLQAVLRLERDLASQPVGLIDETRRPPVLIGCTDAARLAGVEVGQTGPQAMARCASIVLRTARPEAETEARAGLIAAALSVSPQVEDTAPGICTIQVSGLAENRRVPALRAAVGQLETLGLTATGGIAATPLLALYAARYSREQRNQVADHSDVGSALARAPKVAPTSRREAPHPSSGARASALPTSGTYGIGDDGLFSIDGSEAHEDRNDYVSTTGATPTASRRRTRKCPHIFVVNDRREFLRELPLHVAEPPAHVADILTGWGVRTLGELTALSKADVTQRLGTDGLLLWERAAGEVSRPLRLISPPQTFTAEITLEHEIETLEPLLFVLRRFIDRLALELRNASFVAGEIVLGLMLTDDTTYTRAFRLPEPTAQEEILFRVLHTHLESLHTAATVRGATLECRPVRPLARQQGLFESALRDPHGFAETLARVAAVVGPERVGTPVLENSHRADAVKLVAPASVVPPVEKETQHPPHGLPLRRYRSPLHATVELNGPAPVFVWTNLMQGAVCGLVGPWRGSGEWWDASRGWRREEWDAELDSGGVYRLLRTPEGWFVEGEYD